MTESRLYAPRKNAKVGLRPATAEDFWLFEQQAVDPDIAGEFNWSGYRDMAALRRRFEEDGLIGPDGGCLVVVQVGEVVGSVVWVKATYGTPAWWCWNIGISLLPDRRRRGLGTEAQEFLVSYLFATTAVERVEAYTDNANLAEQRALEKAGFTGEGLLRSVQFRAGQWRDVRMYSILREEYRKKKSTVDQVWES